MNYGSKINMLKSSVLCAQEQSIENNFAADSSHVSESADHCISLLSNDGVRPAVNTDTPLLYSADEHQSTSQQHATSLVQRLVGDTLNSFRVFTLLSLQNREKLLCLRLENKVITIN